MNSIPIFFAFSAGLVATLNPCGFALLPTLVSYYLGTNEPESKPVSLGARLWRGLLLGLLVAAGFLTVFAVAGGVAALGSHVLYVVAPWATVLIGVIFILLGGWLLLGNSIYVPLPEVSGNLKRRSAGSMFLYGVSYAVASLSCTLPVFLVVVGSSIATGGILAAAVLFTSYALGMSVVLVVVILGAVTFQAALTRRLRGVLPYVERISAGLLILAGIYLIYYQVSRGALG